MEEIQQKLAELEDLINNYREENDNYNTSEAHRLISEATTLMGRD